MKPVLLVLIFIPAAAGGSAVDPYSAAAPYFLPGKKIRATMTRTFRIEKNVSHVW